MNHNFPVRPEVLEGQINKNQNNLNDKNVPRAPSSDAQAMADRRDEWSKNQTNLFGTDGIRAQVGTFPCTEHDLAQLGYAIGLWAQQKFGSQPRMMIGHDTRESAEFMISALSAGLLQTPIALCNAGVLPTPAVIKIAHLDTSIDGALIITASHNPFQDNGIKLIDAKSGKLSTQDEELITNLFYETLVPSAPHRGRVYTYKNATQSYAQAIEDVFPAQFLQGKKIILDCANGATSAIASQLFAHFGASVTVLNNHPDGRNINHKCGATHPEQLQRAVMQESADIGFAFDGDGDRIVAVNKDGMIKDGDDILALLLDHPAYTSSPTLVCTVMSNGGLENFVQSKKKTLLRTPVGDKHVSAALKKEQLLIGGEQSGHILLADFLLSSDGIFTALRVCQAAQLAANWSLHTFDRLAQILINIPVKEKRDLAQPDIATIIEREKMKLADGSLVVRYSGTENLLRIMIQHKDEHHAKIVGDSLSTSLKKILT